ncbi:MAG: hypothetical protein EOP02_00540 [Proteobacteria bacterium]|nr:MAG: hypothetical protein EOP02_00540 [Pseudomonadota bacterium]
MATSGITAMIGRQVRDNTWTWALVFLAMMAAAGSVRFFEGHPSAFGDMMAFSGMIAGSLIMIKSQEGWQAPAEDDSEVT